MAIKLAFCSLAFRNDSIESVWQKVADIGYDAIEIFWGQLENLDSQQLETLAKSEPASKCPALVLSPYLCFTRGKELYDESIERLKRVIETANILDVPKIRTFVDVGPTGVASAVANETQWQAGFEGLRAACQMAQGKTILLETHDNTLADCLAGVNRIYKNVDADNLKLIIHPSADTDFGGIDGFLSVKNRVGHMHLNNKAPDGSGTWVESGSFDFREYFIEIIKRGYSGSVSIEYCFKGATWELAASAEKFLRDCLTNTGDKASES